MTKRDLIELLKDFDENTEVKLIVTPDDNPTIKSIEEVILSDQTSRVFLIEGQFEEYPDHELKAHLNDFLR